VRRWVAAAALHPYARPNGATGERLTEPIGDSYNNADGDADGDADRDADRDADGNNSLRL
jgi:hypothetical protein